LIKTHEYTQHKQLHTVPNPQILASNFQRVPTVAVVHVVVLMAVVTVTICHEVYIASGTAPGMGYRVAKPPKCCLAPM